MEAKLGTLRGKDKKRFISIENKFLEEQPATPSLTTKGMKKFWKG